MDLAERGNQHSFASPRCWIENKNREMRACDNVVETTIFHFNICLDDMDTESTDWGHCRLKCFLETHHFHLLSAHK